MYWTNGGLYRVMNDTIQLSTDTLKLMLLNSAYVFNPDHEFVSAIVANELSGTGYTGGFGGGGRKTVAGKVFAKDDTNDCATLDITDPVWAAADFGTAGFVALIKEVTNDAASPVIAVMPLPANSLAQGGSFTVNFGSFMVKLRAV